MGTNRSFSEHSFWVWIAKLLLLLSVANNWVTGFFPLASRIKFCYLKGLWSKTEEKTCKTHCLSPRPPGNCFLHVFFYYKHYFFLFAFFLSYLWCHVPSHTLISLEQVHSVPSLCHWPVPDPLKIWHCLPYTGQQIPNSMPCLTPALAKRRKWSRKISLQRLLAHREVLKQVIIKEREILASCSTTVWSPFSDSLLPHPSGGTFCTLVLTSGVRFIFMTNEVAH